MRFFAALAVVVYHMRDYSLEGLRGGPLEKAHLAVDLFFILSGFILTHVYGAAFSEGANSVKEFLVARVARIYPAHLTMMIVFLVYVVSLSTVGIPYNAERYQPESFLWHITLLDATGLDDHLTWNFPAWSISAEFFAYLMFPFVIRPLMQLSPRTASYSLLCLLAIFMPLNRFLHFTQRTVDFSIMRILPEFIMGILAYRSRTYLIARFGNSNIGFACTIVILAVLIYKMMPDAMIVADFVPIIVFGAAMTNLLQACLAWRPLVYLGEASYSLYLVHAFILSVFYNAYKLTPLGVLIPVGLRDSVVLVAVLLGASMLYHLIEKPGRQLVRRVLFDARSSSPQPEALP